MGRTLLRAGIYPRVSTIHQVREGFSLEAQRENLSFFVKSQGWTLWGDYSDEGISGKNIQDRPGVKRLIQDIKDKKIDVVVLYKFDRLTRDSKDTEDFIELIQKYNVLVYTLSGGYIDVSTPSGRFNTRVLGAAAQYERETIIDRVIDGLIKKVKNGYSLCSSTCSYGYDRPKHQEVQTINKEEAEVVKRIFNLYLQGKTFSEIAEQLNIEQIRPKNYGKVRKKVNSSEYYVVKSIFQPKTIKMILSNPNYVGNVRYGCNREQASLEDVMKYSNRKKGFITKGLHEAIIDQKTFDKVSSKLKKRKSIQKINNSRKELFFLGSLCCGICGHPLTTNRTCRNKQDGSKKFFLGYRCINREKHICSARGMSHKKVEKVFLKFLDTIANLEEMDSIDTTDRIIDRTMLNVYKKKLLQKKNKIIELKHLFLDDTLKYNEYKELGKVLEIEIRQLTRNIKLEEKKIASQQVSIDRALISKNIKDHWMYLNSEEKRDFLNEFIDRIIIINQNDNRKKGLPEIVKVEFNEE